MLKLRPDLDSELRDFFTFARNDFDEAEFDVRIDALAGDDVELHGNLVAYIRQLWFLPTPLPLLVMREDAAEVVPEFVNNEYYPPQLGVAQAFIGCAEGLPGPYEYRAITTSGSSCGSF